MRALFRTVTGSPASRKEKGKGRKPSTDQYSVADVAACWAAVKDDIGVPTTTTLHLGEGQHSHASTSTSTSQKITNGSAKQTLDALSRNLDIIVDALVNEQSVTSSDESTGPCLEYILTNNVFTSLSQSAAANNLEGLLGVVLRVFDNLVILLGDAFITYAHRPLNQLIRDCIIHHDDKIIPTQGGHANSQLRISPAAEPYEEELASLLCSIASRIKTLPDLLPLFFHDKRIGHRAPLTSAKPTLVVHHDATSNTRANITSPTSSLAAPEMAPSSSQQSIASSTATSSTNISDTSALASEPVSSQQYSFLLFDFLIRLLHRQGRVGELARTGLLFIVDLAMSPGSKITTSLHNQSKSRSDILDLDATAKLKSRAGDREHRPKRIRRRRLAIIGQSDRLALLTYIQNSDFADVLGAGLGAAYAVLPSRLYLPTFGITSQALVHDANGLANATNATGHERLDVWEAIRCQGIAISVDPDVVEALDLFKTMLNFAVDVTRKAPTPSSPALGDPQSPRAANGQEKVIDKMQCLLQAIRRAYCNVFLNNALLPKIADAASPTAEDAAIVAVLTYMDRLLRALERGNPLQEDLISSLLTREHGKTTANVETSSMRDNVRRIVSYCLTPVLSDQADSDTAKGDLSSRLTSPLQMAALHFVQALLETADSSALELFDVTPSLGCTSFPFRNESHNLDLEEERDFKYPDSDNDSDATSFIYPAMIEPKLEHAKAHTSSLEALQMFVTLTCGSAHSQAAQSSTTPRSKTPVRRRGSSSPSIDVTATSSTLSDTERMKLRTHIVQAEASLQCDMTFIRGKNILESSLASADSGSLTLNGRSANTFSPNTTTTALSEGTFSSSAEAPASLVESDPMPQHKVDCTLGTMAHIHALLTTFFANDPCVNFALTSVIAKLAICPYRSLHGWLVPLHCDSAAQAILEYGLLEVLSPDFQADQSSTMSPSLNGSTDTGTAKVSDWLKHSSSFHTQMSAREEEEEAMMGEEDSLLIHISRLLHDVKALHREQLSDFDKLLKDRRKHILFMQDLADAMTGEDTLSDYDTKIQSMNSNKESSIFGLPRMPGGLTSPARSRVRSLTGSDGGHSVSPYAAHKRSTATREIRIRVPNEAGREGTGFVPSPASMQRVWSASSSTSNAGSGVASKHPIPQAPAPAATPSKMINETAPTRSELFLLSDLRSPRLPAGEAETAAYREVPVNLSKYLDNLVILEESIQEIIAIIVVRLKYGIDEFK